jgi:hypothetical protein
MADKQYRCSKHGLIGTRFFGITVDPGNQPPQEFRYCHFCFNELLAKHCHQVTEEPSIDG